MVQRGIGALEEFEVGRPTAAQVGAIEVTRIRRDDGVLAMTRACPHYGLPLSGGHFDGDRLICPFHQACSDVSTGGRRSRPAGATCAAMR